MYGQDPQFATVLFVGLVAFFIVALFVEYVVEGK